MRVEVDRKPKRDLEVFSRQQLVIGKHGLDKLLSSTLYIVGADGLGAELAKNCLLAGISQLFLCDNQPITDIDISTNVSLHHFTLLY
jgi:ubiquitin-activating enzyme E1